MPSYTHTQRAEPVLVAHWLLAYCGMFFRDADRLADCRKRLNFCPLGSGAVAGATLPLDRAGMAKELGFDAPTANSMDATSDRDFAIEFVQALSLLAVHLSRWAEEFILFSTQEYGFVQLPEATPTGSSAMPQKKNPDALELIRGKAGRVIGAATQLLVTVKGLPLAYNKDLQETQEPVLRGRRMRQHDARIAAGLLDAVDFDFERMQAGGQHWLYECHGGRHLSGQRRACLSAARTNRLARPCSLCLEKGCELEDLSLTELHQFSLDFAEDVYQHLTLASVLGCHDVKGGTAPERVREALAEMRDRIGKLGV